LTTIRAEPSDASFACYKFDTFAKLFSPYSLLLEESMKNILALTVALAATLLGSALAAPFTAPQQWSTSKPSEVKPGGVFRDSVFGDFTSLNPFTSRVSPSLPNILAANGFFRLDPAAYEYVPYMAESYSLSADKLSWTINIRKGMKWSDGKPIIADDFVVAYKIRIDTTTGSAYRDSYSFDGKLATIIKIDSDTVKISFPYVMADALEKVNLFTPQPAHVFGPVYEKNPVDIKEMWAISANPETIVVAGPWKLTSYRPGERATFVKNPFFGEWNKDSAGKALPYLDGYQVNIFKDQNAQLAQFLAGQIDSFDPRNSDDLAQIKRATDGGSLKATLLPNVSATQGVLDRFSINLNAKDPWKQKLLRNADLRRALSHLANRAAMVQLANGGLGKPVYSNVPLLFKNFLSPNTSKFDFDPEAARKLLVKIGFTKKNADGILIDGSGKALELELIANAGNNRREALGRVFVDEAKKIGVKVNFRSVDSGTWQRNLVGAASEQNHDMIIYSITGGGFLFPFSEALFGCAGSLKAYNKSGKCLFPWETQLQALVNRGLREPDATKRRQFGFQIQEVETAQQPIVYMTTPNWHTSYNSRIEGEYPRDIMDEYVGSRILALTWIKE
jgi:peptide/nickel transport system substrate-binding protein